MKCPNTQCHQSKNRESVLLINYYRNWWHCNGCSIDYQIKEKKCKHKSGETI
jgi:hypothetical protein